MTTNRSKEDVVQEFRIQTIQEATMRVIARKGMSAATMQEIADEAGVAKGTLYLYFRDRDDLVEKTFESAMDELMVEIDRALETHGSFEEKLRGVMTAKFAFFSRNRDFFRLYVALRMPEGDAGSQRRHQRKCEPRYRGRVEKLAAAVEQAIRRGEIRRVDPRRLALFIIEGSNAVILERLSEPSPPADEVEVEFVVSLLVDGVRKRSRS